jgi:phosphatidylserine/phosphatidylglycerophosphate/cardiolipin synthase-like enzyme
MSTKITILFLFFLLILGVFCLNFDYFTKINNTDSSNLNTSNFYSADLNNQNFEKVNLSVFFCPEDNCKEKIISLIDDSKNSIECALYSITDDDVAQAFILKSKDIDIKLVTDLTNTNRSTSKVGLLKANGVLVITNSEKDKYMHNKYCVFDKNILLIGSANFTFNSLEESNNDILVIPDTNLAKEYSKKINSYFTDNFSKNYFLKKKIIKNTEINFCPNDNCFESVVKYLRASKESIYCMLYSYTLNDFTYELKRLKALHPNLDIKIIIEEDICNYPYCEYTSLLKDDIEIIFDKNKKNMHHKFCVFDNSVVMTGSMNMSLNGISNNEESLIFISDENLASKYLNYFNKYWAYWNNENTS